MFLDARQGPLHHTKGQPPFFCYRSYSTNVVNDFISNSNNHHHIVVINVLYSFIDFLLRSFPLPQSLYLLYCSGFSGLVPSSSVSTPVSLVFHDACASFSTLISSSGIMFNSTTDRVLGVDGVSVIFSCSVEVITSEALI